MRRALLLAAAAVSTVAVLTACSAIAPSPTSSPSETTRGTITLPSSPMVSTPTGTATPTPEPSGSPTALAFPRSGVDPHGLERNAEAEARFLGLVGYGGESLLDAQGRTYVSVIEEAEGLAPSEDYLLNIVYAGCAEAMADTAATPPDQMEQQIINQTAAELGYATAEEVVDAGYAPVIRTGLLELCGTKFASLAGQER